MCISLANNGLEMKPIQHGAVSVMPTVSVSYHFHFVLWMFRPQMFRPGLFHPTYIHTMVILKYDK